LISVRDLAQVIQKEVDIQLNRESKPVEYVSIPDRPYNDQRYLIDISKVERELGWQPKTPFDEGKYWVVSYSKQSLSNIYSRYNNI
jgi:dTDP-glucose 4,6-dehydratase